MFQRLYDRAVLNQDRFGQMSFTYAAGFLWVMTLLTIGTLILFTASVDISALEISVIPWPLAELTPQLTAQTSGFGAFVVAFIGACIFAPFVEEAFRAAILQALCEKKDTREMRNFFVILALSVFLFGMLHGGYYNILIQGVLGLLLARLWFNVGRDYRWRYLSMVAVHAAYNFTILGIQLMILKAVN